MQMNHICLIELGECGNVCTRVGNVDSKKIMFFKKEKSKQQEKGDFYLGVQKICLLYTSPSPRD